ncbi:Lysozyme, partial [Folsomia candida]
HPDHRVRSRLSRLGLHCPLNGRYWVPLSLADGQSLLADDLVYGNYEGCVRTYNAFAGLNADMFSALVSFTFNLGCGNFQISALLEYLNAGNTLAASLELRKWINAGGQPLLGLARRRESERQLFCASGGCPTSCRARDPNLGAFIVAVYDEWVNLPVFERVVGDDVFGNPYWFLVGPGYVSAAYMEVTEGHGGWCSTTLASNATSNQV